jgi:hypothetical protein
VRLVRPILLVGAAIAVAVAGVASANPPGPNTLTFTDPAGDNVSPSSASDITGVTWSTLMKGKAHGLGKGRGKYTPTALVVTLTLAAAPASDSTVYAVDANLPGCGDFLLTYAPGATLESFNYADCGGDPSDPTTQGSSTFDAAPEVVGSSIVWTLPFKSLPGDVKPGTTFTGLNAYTDFTDPAIGLVSPSLVVGVPLYDTAKTDKPYVVG